MSHLRLSWKLVSAVPGEIIQIFKGLVQLLPLLLITVEHFHCYNFPSACALLRRTWPIWMWGYGLERYRSWTEEGNLTAQPYRYTFVRQYNVTPHPNTPDHTLRVSIWTFCNEMVTIQSRLVSLGHLDKHIRGRLKPSPTLSELSQALRKVWHH